MSNATHKKYLEQDKLFLLELFTKEKSQLRDDREALRAANRGIREHCDNLAFHRLNSRKRLKLIATYLRGYKETHELGAVWRDGAALMPLRMRESLKALVKKTYSVTGGRPASNRTPSSTVGGRYPTPDE